MRFFAVDPEDLPAGLLQDLALLLDRRHVDPVLGVQEPALAGAFRFQDAADTGQRAVAGQLFREPSAWKSGLPSPKYPVSGFSQMTYLPRFRPAIVTGSWA